MPVPAVKDSTLKLGRGVVRRLAAVVGYQPTLPYSQVIASYKGKKRARYERAFDSLKARGFVLLPDDWKLTMFVKQEGVRFTHEKVEPDCRAIQFRSFEYTLYLAARIRRAEHALYEVEDFLGVGTGKIFAKNMNDVERGTTLRSKFDRLGSGCVALMLDVLRFDAHPRPATLEMEHLFWNGCNPDPGLKHALKQQLENEGSFSCMTDLGFLRQKYRVSGGRMSGDANTAGGNCVIVSAALIAFCEKYLDEFDILCDGDDSVLMYVGSRPSDEVIFEFFRGFGLTIKIEGETNVFSEIDFCQSRPCFINGEWTMVRNPEKVLTKLGMRAVDYGPSGNLNYIKTVALGELSRLRGVPILQTFLAEIVRQADSALRRGGHKRRLILGALLKEWRFTNYLPGDWMDAKEVPITEEARQTFSQAWGISVSEQKRIESELVKTALVSTDTRTGRAIEGWAYDWDRCEIVHGVRL